MIGQLLAAPIRVLNVAAVVAAALAHEADLCDPPRDVNMLERLARAVERAGDRIA